MWGRVPSKMFTPHLGGRPRKVTHQGLPSRAWDPHLPAPGPALHQPLAVTLPRPRLHPAPGRLQSPPATLSHTALPSPLFRLGLHFMLLFRGKKKNPHICLSQQMKLSVPVQNKGCGPQGAWGSPLLQVVGKVSGRSVLECAWIPALKDLRVLKGNTGPRSNV